MIKTHLLAALMLPMAAALAVSAPASAAAACAGRAHCAEVTTFAAQLTDFRTSVIGTNRRVTATVNFQNKTDRPLVIGYVKGSGVALDELGNRYTVENAGPNAVRGMGEIERNTFDPRFTLAPGERSDARFELNWYAGNQIVGVEFRLELVVREIDSVAGNQYRLGREHVLTFDALRDGLAGASAAAGTGSAPVAASSGSAPAVADPCAGNPRCHAAGPFVAELLQLSPSQKATNHFVQARVRFRNVSNLPVILAYQQNSGTMLDNYGQRYTVDWRSENVAGIGQTSKNKADPQFKLSPGEARTATLTYSRYVGKTAIGTVFSPEFVVEQLEILPSRQIRSMREYSVNFSNLATGATATDVADAAKELKENLKSIFKRK